MTASDTRPAAILFDWDNTLVDSWPIIHSALGETFAAMGQTPWSLDETKARVRHSLRDSFPRQFGERWAEARTLYLDRFEAIHLERLKPLAGAADLLAELAAAGTLLGIVSNKTGRLLRREIAALGWQPWFHRMIGAGDAERDKPDPAPVHQALAGTGIATGAAVWFVGDTDIDLACARAAGCLPVLVGADVAGLAAEAGVPHAVDCHALAAHWRQCSPDVPSGAGA